MDNLNGREITLNPCSLVCFIRLEILGILDILRLPFVSVSSCFCLLCHPNVFSSLIFVFKCKDITILNQ